jgi:putative ABC transport system permease protein
MRDLLAMRGQVGTIALVVAAGVAVFVASISTYNSLQSGRDRFYAEAHFPQVFVTVKRAPLSLVPRLSEIAGVVAVEPRIVRDVIVDWPASTLPVSARIVSISRAGDESLSRLYLRAGSAPEPGDAHNAVINEAFADANSVQLGTDLRIVLNGRVQSFHVTGVGLSPEYVYAVKSGLPIPDDRLYAILWIDRSAAEAAFEMKGAFNDIAVALAPDADPKAVVGELDRLLEPYGSVGAIERRDQSSNRFLEDELNQQEIMSVTIPIVFLGVAAFLINAALGRIVAAQREQIAALKALGFSTTPLVLHYLKLVAVIVLLGSAIGVGTGLVFGSAMIASYHGFFRLPMLVFELTPWSAVAAATISLAAASFGAVTALHNVVKTAPAVAMQPPVPRRSRRFAVESLLSTRRVPSPRRIMILRNVAGRPFRTALSVAGIALAVPMVVLGLFWRDAIDRMIEVQFNLIDRSNVAVTFPHPLDSTIVGDLARQPGVLAVEGQRIVPVRLRAGHRTYLTSVTGLAAGSELVRPHDAALQPIEVSSEGITLTRRLAERLGVGPGDIVTVEVMEGRRERRDLPVTGSVDETIGMASYMDINAVNRMTGEGAAVSGAVMFADPYSLPLLSMRFKELPVIESVAMKSYTLASFLDKVAGLVFVAAGVLTAFGAIIAVGVVYNSARIGLQERAWELASLRVLGFTRSEVADILFNEFALEVAVGVPAGLAVARAIVGIIARFHSNESFQIPAVIEPRTYALAAIVVAAAATVSALLVRRQLDRLDLVAVLKTRD